MSRSKGGRTYSSDSIVIVCEGTETEFPYFQEFCQSHDGWRVVPQTSERITKDRKSKRTMKCRKLKKGDSREYQEYEYYVGLPEENEATYNTYKHEPLKWVRAAQLFKERYRYYEAWAVYDLDKYREKYHPEAYKHAAKVENLHIAFSSYSFEEWLLLHFERNKKAFSHSECKSEEDIKCGHKKCKADWNCHGEKCIWGRLREGGFLPDSQKNNGAEFANLTKERRHIAYVNAAWVRTLSSKPVYERNPYSDVDKLVMRLLNESYDIRWVKISESFKIEGEPYKIEKEEDELKLLYIGNKSFVRLKTNQIYWCDERYKKKASIIDEDLFEFNQAKHELSLSHCPDNMAVVCIKGKGNVEIYCELKEE